MSKRTSSRSAGTPPLRGRGANSVRKKSTRKNIAIDQDKLDLARKLLMAPTETATVDQALDLVVFQAEVLAGIDEMVAVGGIADSFEDDR
jgi:hypothetical protein